jgi:hypothetical protein
MEVAPFVPLILRGKRMDRHDPKGSYYEVSNLGRGILHGIMKENSGGWGICTTL